jgi:predicted nucleic acid-binding protein
MQSADAAVNGVVITEVVRGARDESAFDQMLEHLSSLTNLQFGGDTWRLAASLGFSLRRAGVTASLGDLLIAASAIEHDVVLIHADSDFDRIAQHSDLKVESYAGA